VAYHNGNGVEQDKNKAIYWFRKACENFNDDACKNLNRIK
ncbi:MAG: sel1 repeat family protein, partial [Riemerella sp.]